MIVYKEEKKVPTDDFLAFIGNGPAQVSRKPGNFPGPVKR